LTKLLFGDKIIITKAGFPCCGSPKQPSEGRLVSPIRGEMSVLAYAKTDTWASLHQNSRKMRFPILSKNNSGGLL